MNLMSSMAKTFVGSVIASVSVVPERPTGMTWYLAAVSPGNQADDGRVEIELAEIDGRDAVLPAEQRRDLFVADEPQLDEVRPQPPAVGALMVQRLLQLAGRDALFAQQ